MSKQFSEVVTTINNNIDKWLNFGMTSGLDWYSSAHDFAKTLSVKYNKPVQMVAGLIAATSPMKSWPLNKKMVEEFLQGIPIGHLGNQVYKCKSIVELDYANMYYSDIDTTIMTILRGKKTSSFYHNIMYPNTSSKVTVDVHIWNALNPGWNFLTDKRYDILEKSIKQKAKELNIPIASVQASIWVNYKQHRYE